MDLSHERLESLIEFARQTALLQKKPLLTVKQHNNFSVYEDDLRTLPGVHLSVQDPEQGEIWFRLDRLYETKPPIPGSVLLATWIDLKGTPQTEPTLKNRVSRDSLVKIGAIAPDSDGQEQQGEREAPSAPPDADQEEQSRWVNLEDFSSKEELEVQMKSYTQTAWRAWAVEEKERRKSIRLYADLFMLVQQMQGNLGDSQLELVWGIGVATWDLPRVGEVVYPLISQLVEIAVNEENMSIEVRPRTAEPKLEVDAYAAADNAGVGPLSSLVKDFFKKSEIGLSPFEPSTFEPVIRSASSLLDAQGQYLPVIVGAEDRSVPKPGEHLAVTDTWVFFARPRDSNLFLQDLQRFQDKLDGDVELPAALQAILTDPSKTVEDFTLPPFRGLSYVCGSHGVDAAASTQQELYFPKPYNDEQVKIIQLLEVHDGVVVQGPPGTGKTHTIANVISHYLANGKRVLVTSMKDPALAVLQEKLPEDIRPLAISLLSSEAEGMKQFEFAIEKISAEVQRIDRVLYKREIAQIDGEIDAIHAQISSVDREINIWAERNLSDIVIDGEAISPTDAAVEIASKQEEIAWFPDQITADESHRPQFNAQDIIALRDARLALRGSLAYLGQKLPQLTDFPEAQKLIQVHQDLVHETELQEKESSGTVPRLLSTGNEHIQDAMALADRLSNLRLLRNKIKDAAQAWVPEMLIYLRRNGQSEMLNLFLALKGEIEEAMTGRKEFIAKPVTLPFEHDAHPELIEAVQNLSEGRRPFGLSGLLGKSAQKQQLDGIQILGAKPESSEDWAHVHAFIQFQQHCKTLLLRWNALVGELPLPSVGAGTNQLIQMNRVIELFGDVQRAHSDEALVESGVSRLLPIWTRSAELRNDPAVLSEAESILLHHLTRYRLAETWAAKEAFQKALSGCGGEITERLRGFLKSVLGNPDVNTTTMQAQWSELMDELRRVLALGSGLQVVTRVTDAIAASGAKTWATRLRQEPSTGPADMLLPGNCLEIWRLRRLATYLESIDGRHELKRLFKKRAELERDLGRLYQEAVVKRTWLRLAENATHGVRAALELYRAAIRKIGKGTGVRAGRYRQDARLAAETANSAIPCWIMPHYRICESLPVEYGAFDLVIIDEASQSDMTALPALLRAKKVLIVGDDKQVSPEGIGMDEDRLQGMMTRFLGNQVDLYRPLMSPERSIYDLFKVVFAKSAIMLREHFRCVTPIIEYSKREFYNHELKPLRLPMMTERLDPPLIDLKVMDGWKKGKINLGEARVIIEEIRRIVDTPDLNGRTIGVVSLLGAEQAQKIMQMLTTELGEEVITKFKINCGDARTFQGKERDIMFLSMVVSPGDSHAQTRDAIAQRFNVAASRARDRMYLVRSVDISDLSQADRLRRGLIQHFETPFAQDPIEVTDLKLLCESPFEREVYDELTCRGYRVMPQVAVGSYRIDMVVEGDNDSRLAIECDGDRFHGPDQWDSDMRRQRILERAGWRFWRCFASTFTLNREQVIQDLLDTLAVLGIEPASGATAAPSIHVEQRRVYGFPEKVDESLTEQESAESDADAEDESVPEADPASELALLPGAVDSEPVRLGVSAGDEQRLVNGHQAEMLLLENLEKSHPIRVNAASAGDAEVEIGDLVRYCDLSEPDEHLTVCITESRSDLDNGFIPAVSPLAQTLLGLTVEEEAMLHIPGKRSKTFKVLEVVKAK